MRYREGAEMGMRREGEGGGDGMIVYEIEYDTFWGFGFVRCLVWFGWDAWTVGAWIG